MTRIQKIDDPSSYSTKTINWEEDKETVVKHVLRIFLFNKEGELLLRFQSAKSGDESFLLGPTALVEAKENEEKLLLAQKALKETTKLKSDLMEIGETVEVKPKQVTKATLFVGISNSLPGRNDDGETFVFADETQVSELYHQARLYFGYAFDEKLLKKWFEKNAFKKKK